MSPLQPTRGSGERRELPQRGCLAPGGGVQSPGRKRILAYFEGHRTLLFVSIWQKSEGTICTSVPYSKFWGTCPPRPSPGLRPWTLVHCSSKTPHVVALRYKSAMFVSVCSPVALAWMLDGVEWVFCWLTRSCLLFPSNSYGVARRGIVIPASVIHGPGPIPRPILIFSL